ncbi:MAG: Site-specific recombinase XerD [Streptosporangiaceae bacterium]|jgi:integrase|nr:Site-specific recombinase XerD [Streptosporangiaceae bacterium]
MIASAAPGTAAERATVSSPAVSGHAGIDGFVSESARARILDGVATNTRRAYGRQWDAFTAWCIDQGRTALPATAETLAEYVSALADAAKGPASIEQAIAAIRTAHRTAGHFGAPDTQAARLALRSHRRELAAGGERTRQAPPITVEVLRAMIDATSPVTVIGARDRLLLVLGLAMMARRSELAALHLDDVVETDDGLEVLIRASKTDQDARGAVVAVPRGSHPETDPVRLLQEWRSILAQRGIISGRLLRSVTRHSRIGASLSPDAVSDAVRAAAVRAGVPQAESYSAHSLRAGGATTAYRAGAPVSAIAAHGRWSPASPVVLGYVRSVDRWRDNPMRAIGL